jgi:hypothetical protein
MPIDFTRARYPDPTDSLGYLLHQVASGLAWLAREGADVTQKGLEHYLKASLPIIPNE